MREGWGAGDGGVPLAGSNSPIIALFEFVIDLSDSSPPRMFDIVRPRWVDDRIMMIFANSEKYSDTYEYEWLLWCEIERGNWEGRCEIKQHRWKE